MRALIDIPDAQVRAVADFIASRERPSRSEALGLWGAGEDGLAYEDRIRGDW